MHSSLPFLAALAATAAAKTVVIDVGQSGLSFTPDSSTADVGDTLEFHFFGSIHSAVQGDFATPCQMSASGFDSGPIDNGGDGSGSVFQVMVTSTDPIWVFCGTPGHCQSGMAGVINPPSSGDSLASYKSSAAGTSTKSDGTLQGGVVVPVPIGGGSSSSPASTTASSVIISASSTVVTPTKSAVLSASSVTSSVVSSVSKISSTSASAAPTKSTTSTTSGGSSNAATATLSGSTSQSAASSSSAGSSSLAPPPAATTSAAVNAVGGSVILGAVFAGLSVLVALL